MKRKIINVVKADYLGDYRVLVEFNDGKRVEMDFEPFLFKRSRGYYDKYRDLKHFKKFKIENGNLVWGKDWDLIFEVGELHDGKFAVRPKKRHKLSENPGRRNFGLRVLYTKVLVGDADELE